MIIVINSILGFGKKNLSLHLQDVCVTILARQDIFLKQGQKPEETVTHAFHHLC